MKIVQVITPSRVSGAERYVLFLCEELIKKGYDVIVIVEEGQRLVKYLRGRLRVIPLKMEGKGNILGYLRLKKVIYSLNPLIIHTHLTTASLFGGLVARYLSIPVVSTVHAINSKWPYIMSDRIIAVSDAVAQHLLSQGVLADRLRVGLNGIPLPNKELSKVISNDGLKRHWGIPINNFVIGVIAHFSSKKGHIYLFKALSCLGKNITLFLLGEGRLESSLKRLCDRLSIRDRVIFAGFQDDINKFYKLFDLVVLPSIKGEGLPLSILEAQGNGIPVIASSISGIGEVIKSGVNGYLVSPKDINDLRDKINILIHNASIRGDMSKASRNIVYNRFSIEKNTNTVLSIYKELSSKIIL